MYKRGARGWLKHVDFLLVDIVALQLACMVAYALRFDGRTILYGNELYSSYVLMLTVLDVLAVVLFNTMHNVLKRGWYKELAATVKHVLLVFAMMTFYLVSAKISGHYSRIFMYMNILLYMALGYALRILYKRVLHRMVFREMQRAMLVVALEKDIVEIVQSLREHSNDVIRIAGVVLTDRDAKGEQIGDLTVVENLRDAAGYICRGWIDEVLIGTSCDQEAVNRLVEQCSEMGVVIHECLQLERSVRQKQFVEKLGGYTVLTSSVNYATPLQALIKRSMDIVGALIGCVAALIIMAIVGPMIKKESPGPILYSQERIGQNGRRFKFYKIRSMYLDADARKAELMSQNRVADGRMFKLDFDPRIIGNQVLPDGTKKTGIGAFIRRTSLDEFPQFFNVLKGDMSLVGTRPPTVDEWERYELHHRMRLAMKPGLTGMWQVSGRSRIVDFEEVVKLDTQYIHNWSLGLDFRILVKTVKMVLKRDGAM